MLNKQLTVSANIILVYPCPKPFFKRLKPLKKSAVLTVTPQKADDAEGCQQPSTSKVEIHSTTKRLQAPVSSDDKSEHSKITPFSSNFEKPDVKHDHKIDVKEVCSYWILSEETSLFLVGKSLEVSHDKLKADFI